MTAPTSGARLGNVAGAVLLSEATLGANTQGGRLAAQRVAGCFASLFDETLLVGGTPDADWPGQAVSAPNDPAGELSSMLLAWDAAKADRVLIADSAEAGQCADLLLALTAWPETDAVAVTDEDEGSVLCSLYRKSVCADIARRVLAEAKEEGGATREAFWTTLRAAGEVSEIPASQLGLADWRAVGSAQAEAR